MQVILNSFKSVSYKVEEPLVLECGDTLRDLRIHYTTYGELNDAGTNAVWVFHALTANSDPLEWWPGVIGNDASINPEDHFIVCANMLGSCYGSTEPSSFDFPLIAIGDMVRAYDLLRQKLGVDRIKIGIGGSMGGQQLLEWAVRKPDLFEMIVPIATSAKHSAWGIAFNEAQRMALKSEGGLSIARAIAMLSYRHYDTFAQAQTDQDGRYDNYSASSYLHHQGDKLNCRFSRFSYYYLSKAMDSHDVGRHYGGVENALARISSKALIIGIDSDLLFPTVDQERLARSIRNSSLHIINSRYGHDGFLIETKQINDIIKLKLT